MRAQDKILVMLSVFVTALICSNLLGSKITVILGVPVSVGIFAYPITFLMTDMVEEVYGRKKTKLFIIGGVLALLLTLVLYKFNDAYVTIFSNSIRIIIASLVAFFLSQIHDIWAFNFWKKKTKGRFLWLRNNLSTAVSQFIDTTIFMFIAFYAITPDYTAAKMFAMIVPYWLLKVLFAIFDTPLCYLGVKWLRKDT